MEPVQLAVRDSHNVSSSLQDLGTGNYYVHIDVDMSKWQWYAAVTASGSAGHGGLLVGMETAIATMVLMLELIRVYSTAGAGSLTDGSANQCSSVWRYRRLMLNLIYIQGVRR